MNTCARTAMLTALLLTGSTLARAAAFTIPAGSAISVRMTDALDTKTTAAGQTFRAAVDAPVTINGSIVVPKGAEAIGRVVNVAPSGRFRGRAVIAVELTAINFEGKSVPIRTSTYEEGGRSRGKQTAKMSAGTIAVGTLIGAVAGAPWLGIGIGAAGGAVVQTVRGPGEIRIPAESLLMFTLQAPMSVTEGM
jgi:hypothetical protein